MISVHIPKSTGHSLSKINRDITKSLKEKFLFKDSLSADVLVQHYVSQIPKNSSYKRKILIQPIDGTKIEPRYVENMNQFDLVIVPALASLKILEKEGVKVPIRIIPNYYDEEIFSEESNFFNERYTEKKYTFYSETTGIKRKNVENILKYFLEEFSGTPDSSKVRLILKLSSVDSLKMKKLKSLLESYEDAPEVDICNKWLEDSDLNSLRINSDCYVALSYMEGFCIPLLNAAVLKKDIIALDTKISGYSDFIGSDNAILLRPNSIPIDTLHESLLIYGKESRWEEPDYKDYRAALRKAYMGEYIFTKDRDFSNFSRESVMKRYEDAIQLKENFFCITSEKHQEDFESVRKELFKLNVDYLTKFIFSRPKEKNYIKRPDLSRLSLSHETLEKHIQVLSRCSKIDSEFFFICEDDVIVLEKQDLLSVIEKAPSDWDVLFLGGMNHQDPPEIVNESFYRCRFSFNPHAYIVRSSFLKTLLDELMKREWEVDVIFAHMQKKKQGNWYGLKKDLVIPDGRKSQRFLKIVHGAPIISSGLVKNTHISSISSHPSVKGVKYYCMRGSSGYAEAAKDYIIGLNREVPVSVEFLVGDNSSYLGGDRNRQVNFLKNKIIEHNITIVHTMPNWWEERFEWNKHSLKVGMTVWETDKVPNEWIHWMNSADKIIVPCEWNKQVFENCGINSPVYVVPHVYREVSPEKYKISGIEKSTFVFLTIGQWTDRKGIDDTIRAYLTAFTGKDNTLLVVKAFGKNYSREEQELISERVQEILKDYSNPAKIELITDHIKDSNISYLHDISHCYVSLCKSEGFGLCMFEAAGKGKPVITTGYGGQLDFLPGPYVNYCMGPVNMKYTWYKSDQNWAYPDVNHAASLLKDVYENYKNYSLLAKKNAERIKRDFSYQAITEKLISFLS